MKAQLSPRQVLSRGLSIVAGFVRGLPWPFALAVTGAALFAAAIIASSLVIGWITDSAILPVLQDGANARSKLLPVIAAVIGVALWKAVAIVLRRTSAGYMQFRTQRDLRSRLVAHQMGLELAWFGQQSIGDLLSIADNDTQRGTEVLAPLPYATGVSLLVIGTIVMLSIIDPYLGLVGLAGLAVIIFIEGLASFTLYPAWEGIQTQSGVVSGVAHESFDGALTVKALGRETHEAERLRTASDELRDRFIDVGVRWETFRTVIVVLIPVTSLVMVMVGAMRVDAGAITPGDVVSALYLLSLLTFPIQLIAFVLFDLAISIPAWDRVAAVLDADDLVEYGPVAARPGAGAASLGSEVLTFGYDDIAVLADVEVSIPAGRTIAVVGTTGSGKTTLALLMARLWDPKSGAIAIDGRDLRAFARYELPKEIAFVAQSAFLFDDTVRSNIAMGLEVSRNEIEQAARLAGAHDFIEALPQQYDTPVGERGASLSGGQRQRIALARALIRRPRLLILDDATSAVDPSIEQEILQRLRSADLPSTIVIVAYRPSSIRLADEVIFVSDGRIVDQGPHERLMARQPRYMDLVQAYERDAAARAAESGE